MSQQPGGFPIAVAVLASVPLLLFASLSCELIEASFLDAVFNILIFLAALADFVARLPAVVAVAGESVSRGSGLRLAWLLSSRPPCSSSGIPWVWPFSESFP